MTSFTPPSDYHFASIRQYPSVTLDDVEYQWGTRVGQGRHAMDNGVVRDAKAYADQTQWRLSREQGSVIPTLGELAAAKYLGVYWDGAVWSPNDIATRELTHADIGSNLEVRSIVDPRSGLPVKEKDLKPGRRMVLVWGDPDTQHRTWHMIGTEEASIAWEKGNQKPGQHFRRRPQQTLRPVNTLTRIAEFAPRAIATLERVDITHLEAWQLDSVNFSVDRRLASGESEDITTLREMVAAELIAAKTAGAYWRP
jgi:hypothetical protein